MRTEASRGQSKEAASSADGGEAGIVRASQPDVDANSSQVATDDTAALLGLDARTTATALPPAPGITAAPGERSFNWLGNVMQSLSLDERLGRIILSVVLSALLWFYVTSLENPAQVTQFNGMTLDIRGLNSNLKVINTLPNVNVTVQAPQNIMSSLREADVRPYVEINLLGAGVHEVPVSVDVNGLADKGLLNFSVSPRTVQVQLEVQATRIYSMSARISGTPAFGYSVEAAQLEPSQVSITGSENAINRIAQVVVPVDVDEKAGTQRGYKNPVALDSTGQEITGLTFQPATIQVVVPIKLLLNYKLVPVHIPLEGNPAPGYSAYEIKLDPTNVTICCAPSNILEPVVQLDTEPVSISGATSTVLTTTQLILPPGVELYPGQSREISVTVTINTFETTWQLSVAPTVENLASGSTSVLSPNNIDLTLSGTLAQFQSLKPTDISASVNAETLGPGTFELEPQVIVPQGVRLVSVNPAKLFLTIIPPTPVPPTATPIPTAEPTTPPAPTATANAVVVVEPTQTVAVSPTRTLASIPTIPPTVQPTAQPTTPPATPTHTITASPTATHTLNPTATSTPTPTPGSTAEQVPTPQPPRTPTPGVTPTANPIDPGP